MKKRAIPVLILLLALAAGWTLFPPKTVCAAFDGIIRVRITPSGQSSDIRVIPHGKYFIAEAPVVQLLDTEYTVHMSGSSLQLLCGQTVVYTGTKITITRAAGNTEENFIVFPYSPTHNTRTNYYGNIEFSVYSAKLCAVNHVYVEDYVLGVFPYEMSTSFPAEALKAQAVCARSYGVKAALNNADDTWHLWDSTRSQVYRGVPGVSSSGTFDRDTYEAMRAIVTSTALQVMEYNGNVIEAFYSAWNGGETLNVKGWTGNTSSAYGYTAVQADAYDDAYCQSSFWIENTVNTDLHFSTEGDVNQRIQNMLAEKQFGEGSGRYIVSTTGIQGQAPDLAPEVSIVFENFYCDVLFDAEADTIRVPFTDTDLKAALDISSAYCAFRIENHPENGTTTLYNVRYGHGVGMSQRGAQQMADEGLGYTDILNYYYCGITFGTLGVSPPTLPALPGAPAPSAASASYNSIRVSWNAVPGAIGYLVYRSASAQGPYTLLTSGVASTSYTSSGLTTGTPYYFKIKAYTVSGGSRYYGSLSGAASAVPVPNTPAGLKAVSAGYSSIRFTWNAVPGAGGYCVYRAVSKDGPFSLIAYSVQTNGFTSTGLTTGTRYYYKVKAYMLVGASRVYGNLSSAVSSIPVPAIPQNFAASRLSSTSIKTSWSAVAGATGYEIYRKTSSSGTYLLLKRTAATAYTNKGLKTGNPYYYKVRAYRLVGSKRVYGAFSPVRYIRP